MNPMHFSKFSVLLSEMFGSCIYTPPLVFILLWSHGITTIKKIKMALECNGEFF